MNNSIALRFLLVLGLGWLFTGVATAAENSLVGHWKLQGDCRDYSGHENHGVNHGVDLKTGALVRTDAYVDKPFLNRLHSGEAFGDGGLVFAMFWALALFVLTVTGLIIYLKLRPRTTVGIQKVFW